MEDERDFQGSTASHSITCKSSALSLSSGSSIFAALQPSLTQEQPRSDVQVPALDDATSVEASKLASDPRAVDQDLKRRHVRFSLSSESQDSSSILDSSLRDFMEHTLEPTDSGTSTSSRKTGGVMPIVGCRRKIGASQSSSVTKNYSSIESHYTKNSNESTDNNTSISSMTNTSNDVVSTGLHQRTGRRRRLDYSGKNNASRSLQPSHNNNQNTDGDDKGRNLKLSAIRQPMRQGDRSVPLRPELVPRPVRGAGANVIAIQDAGTQQMLTDECAYLCSTILSSGFWSGGTNSTPGRLLKSLKTASCDLALLLSTGKTRCALWMDGRRSNAATMLKIIDVLGTINSPGLATVPSVSRLLVIQPDELASTIEEEAHSQESNASITSEEVHATGGGGNIIPASIKTAMAALFHFVSWDCTLSEHSAAQWKFGRRNTHSVATIAQRIRRLLLHHQQALQAVGRLIVDDPVTRQILSPNPEPNNMKEMILEPASQESVLSDISGGASQEFVVLERWQDDNENDASSINSKSSQLSVTSGDPTAVGRRRRKRQRILRAEASELDPIVEEKYDAFGYNQNEPTSSNMSPPRKRVYGGRRERSNRPCDQLSFTSHESLPTKSSVRDRNDGDGSVPSMTEVQIIEKLEKINSKLILPEKVALFATHRERVTACCFCHPDESTSSQLPPTSPSCVALHALNRVVSGKEGEEESCMDQDDQDTQQNQLSAEDSEEETNPLLVTNRLLGESGILPFLAQGLAESFQAVACLVQPTSLKSHLCPNCLSHLHGRVSVLASLIDGACCLNADNRRAFCDNEQQGLLIGSLIFLIESLTSHRESSEWHHQSADEMLVLTDIMLTAARILTSLTHENELAAQQLVVRHKFSFPAENRADENERPDLETANVGLECISRLCHLAIQWRAEEVTDKHVYDIIIFCLNTLSNVMDFGNVRGTLLELQVPSHNPTRPNAVVPFFSWLAQWLVSETKPFHDVIIQGTFGAKDIESNVSRDLQKDEDESLVLSGHGMVVLACSMTTSHADVKKEHLSMIKELITQELARAEERASFSGLLLIKNTLKAFCNFYRFSIGELSVAVVEPVRNLLARLDELEEEKDQSGAA